MDSSHVNVMHIIIINYKWNMYEIEYFPIVYVTYKSMKSFIVFISTSNLYEKN